jgi:hypothetical protein
MAIAVLIIFFISAIPFFDFSKYAMNIGADPATGAAVELPEGIEICIDVAKPTAGLPRHMFCIAMRKARNGPDFRLTGPCPNRRLSSTNDDGFPPNSIWRAYSCCEDQRITSLCWLRA